jgi:hypothetical protein
VVNPAPRQAPIPSAVSCSCPIPPTASKSWNTYIGSPLVVIPESWPPTPSIVSHNTVARSTPSTVIPLTINGLSKLIQQNGSIVVNTFGAGSTNISNESTTKQPVLGSVITTRYFVVSVGECIRLSPNVVALPVMPVMLVQVQLYS